MEQKAIKSIVVEAESETIGFELDTDGLWAPWLKIKANEKNKFGKVFKPYLIGVATIQNMHSQDEKMDYKSLLQGVEFVYNIFLKFNEQ